MQIYLSGNCRQGNVHKLTVNDAIIHRKLFTLDNGNRMLESYEKMLPEQAATHSYSQ